jgi:cytochrome c biogenesis protein CcmG, thiol:disulfide interchange protein DsbE
MRMRRSILLAWGLLGIVIVGMIVAWGRTHNPSSLNAPMLTQELKPVKLRGPAPAFSGTTVTGTTLSNASLAGKPAVIDFFSTWCAPCKQEASGLGALAAGYRGRVRFLAVDLDDTSKSDATAFATKHGWDFPIIWDPHDSLPDRFQVAGKPSMVIIDKHGRLVLLVPGPHMISEYHAAIDKVLAE